MAAGSDLLGADPVRSTAGKLMTIPILLPRPLGAARAATRLLPDLIRARLTLC
jgi:hypothetical protein